MPLTAGSTLLSGSEAALTDVGAFFVFETSHQVFPSSAKRLEEALTAHISREILTAALLFLFQCTG